TCWIVLLKADGRIAESVLQAASRCDDRGGSMAPGEGMTPFFSDLTARFHLSHFCFRSCALHPGAQKRKANMKCSATCDLHLHANAVSRHVRIQLWIFIAL